VGGTAVPSDATLDGSGVRVPAPKSRPAPRGGTGNGGKVVFGEEGSCFPTTLAAACPSSEVTLKGDAALRRTLREAAGNSSENEIVLSVFNSAMEDVLDAQQLTVKNANPALFAIWVVVTLDAAAQDYCIKQGWQHCVLDAVFSQEQDLAEEHAFNDDRKQQASESKKAYTRICWRRVEIVSVAVRMGISLIYTDVDIAWLRDPRPFLRPGVHLQMAPSVANREFDIDDESSFSVVGAINAGFYSLRYTPASEEFVLKWLQMGADALHKLQNWKYHEGLGSGRAAKHAISLHGLKYRFLDPRVLPGDKAMFAKFSSACAAAIFHAAPGSGHAHKTTHMLRMLQEFQDPKRCPPEPPHAPVEEGPQSTPSAAPAVLPVSAAAGTGGPGEGAGSAQVEEVVEELSSDAAGGADTPINGPGPLSSGASPSFEGTSALAGGESHEETLGLERLEAVVTAPAQLWTTTGELTEPEGAAADAQADPQAALTGSTVLQDESVAAAVAAPVGSTEMDATSAAGSDIHASEGSGLQGRVARLTAELAEAWHAAVQKVKLKCFPTTTDTSQCPHVDLAAAYGSADLNRTFLQAARSPGANGTLVLSVANSAMADVLQAQFESVNQSAPELLQLWVVVMLDEPGMQLCQSMFINCVLDPVFANETLMQKEHTFHDDASKTMSKEDGEKSLLMYTRICWRRVELVSLALRLGANVIFTDVDVAWLRDPRPWLRTDVDLQHAPSRQNARFNRTDPATYSTPGPLNAGFYSVRASASSIYFVAAWMQLGYHSLHLVHNIRYHEGHAAGHAAEQAIAQAGLRFWLLDPRYTPGDKDMLGKYSDPCTSAIAHAAPGGGHQHKTKYIYGRMKDKAERCWDGTYHAGVLGREHAHAGTDIAMQTTGGCFPSSKECPSSEAVLQGNATLRDALIAASSHSQGDVILSVFHVGLRDLFDVWLEALRRSSAGAAVAPAWVIVSVHPEAHAHCLAQVARGAQDAEASSPAADAGGVQCVLDPAASEGEGGGGDAGGWEQELSKAELLRMNWRAVELLTIAVRLDLEVTLSGLDIAWLDDARQHFHPTAVLQMTPAGHHNTDGVQCDAHSSSCTLGTLLEGFYHIRRHPESLNFCLSWMESGVRHRLSGANFHPGRVVGKALDQHLPLGLNYSHMNSTVLPGDERHAKKMMCTAAIYPIDGHTNKEMAEKMRHMLKHHEACS
ncbi:hypothetical protein CYMTET_9176, partial [Cymbomonas tetramitiformis]